MRVHFIAIGGAVMHNLAIALHKKGYLVSGSDDEIFEPSKSKLNKHGILPEYIGWNADIVDKSIDAVILGMHAHNDNPELIKAKELGLEIYSFPEYLYQQTKNKKRVVIGGSHGKTTITSMVMHVLLDNNLDFDYMVGAQLEGFDTMVRLTDASIAIFEGDEYLSSTLDLRPKFHLYKPHIAVISGIAWDHINVFPTFENYVEQFKIFIDLIEKNGSLIYYENDDELMNIINNSRADIRKLAYTTHDYVLKNGITYLRTKTGVYALNIFGEHNIQNIGAAKHVCCELGISDTNFYKSISSFAGASKRLQLLAKNDNTNVFLDFAHSPSKLKATTTAVKQQFADRELVACMELHTYSSLKEDFLPQYANTMKAADMAYIYFNPDTIRHKRLKEINPEQVVHAFGGKNVEVFTNSEILTQKLLQTNWENKNLLLMSSGNFSGINFNEFAKKIVDIKC